MAAGSTGTERSKYELSSDSLTPDTEALLLRSVLECAPLDESRVLRLDRPKTLALARLTLALLIDVTNRKEDWEDGFL